MPIQHHGVGAVDLDTRMHPPTLTILNTSNATAIRDQTLIKQ